VRFTLVTMRSGSSALRGITPTPSCSDGASGAAVATAFEQTGADAVLLARGSLGNPWLFEQVLGRRLSEPTRDEVLDEVDWVIERAVEHLGAERANRYLRKFYPWYVERLGGGKALQHALQTADSVDHARELLHAGEALVALAVG